MKSYCLLVIVGLFAFSYAAENGEARFLVVPQTIVGTVTNTITTTLPVSITKSCATTGTSLTSCRKRRSVTEEPIIHSSNTDDDDEIGPTEPISIEITDVDHKRRDRAVVSIQEPSHNKTTTPAPVEVMPSIESTAGMAEVQISNLDTVCRSRAANPFFSVGLGQLVSITVLFSSTSTVTATATSFSTTVAKTNTFTILGCLPSPLPFNLC